MATTKKTVELRLLISAVNRAGKQLKDVGNQLQEVNRKAKELADNGEAIGRKGEAGAKRYAASLDKLGKKMKAVSKIGNQLMTGGLAVGTAGVAVVGAALFPIKTAMGFQKAMANVKAVTDGLGESTEEAAKQFEALNEEAKRLGRTTEFKASEAAQGLEFLGMAGLTAAESLKALEPALLLASAGGLQLAESSDIVTNVMSGMGKEASDLTNIVDIMAATAANSNQSVSELGQAFSYAAPYIQAAGMSIEQGSAALALFANAGVKATRGGTALRGIITRLSKVSKEYQYLVKKNADGTVNFSTTLRNMSQEFGADLSKWGDVFGRQFGGIALLLAKSTDELDKFTESLENVEGAAKKMADIKLDTLWGDVKKLASAFEALNQALGMPMLAPLRVLTKGITAFISAMAKASEENSILVGTLMSVTLGLGGLLVAVAAVIIPLGALFRLVGYGGAGFITFLKLVKKSKDGLKLLAGAGTKAGIALRLLGRASIAFGVALTAIDIYRIIKGLIDWRKENIKLRKSLEEVKLHSDELLERLVEFKNYKAPRLEILKSGSLKDAEVALDSLDKAMSFTFAQMTKLQDKARARKFWVYQTEESKEAEEEYENLEKRLKSLRNEYNALYQVVLKGRNLDPVDDSAAWMLEEKPIDTTQIDKEAEAKRKALAGTASMQVSIMKDSAAKIRKLRQLEIEEFRNSEEFKVLGVVDSEARIMTIRVKYAKRLTDFNKRESEKLIAQNRELRSAEMAVDEEIADRKLAIIEDEYSEGNKSLAAFIQQRHEIVMSGFDAQIAEIKKKISEELDPHKRIILEVELRKIEEEKTTAAFELAEEEEALRKERRDTEIAFQDELRQIKMEGFGRADIQEMHNLEMEALISHQERVYASYEQAGIAELDLLELQLAQKQQVKQKHANWEKQLQEMQIAGWASVSGNLQQIFADMYEGSGEQIKAFFYIQKAAAFAEALISAYQASAQALAGPMSKINPYLAMAMSKTILVMGMARAAAIAATTLRGAFEGGLITTAGPKTGTVSVGGWSTGGNVGRDRAGSSPIEVARTVFNAPVTIADRTLPRLQKVGRATVRALHLAGGGPTSPNIPRLPVTRLPTTTRSGLVNGPKGKDVIPAMLTDKEYVMNPKAVAHYGVNVMEALNRRLLNIRTSIVSPTRIAKTKVMVDRQSIIHRYEGGPVGGSPPTASQSEASVASGGVSVSVPVSISAGSGIDTEGLGADLQSEIERTTLKVLKDHLG